MMQALSHHPAGPRLSKPHIVWLGVLALVPLCAAVALYQRQQACTVDAASIDRLRIMASTGQDSAALAQLQTLAQQGQLSAMHATASVLLQSPHPGQAQQGLTLAYAAAQRGDPAAQYLLGKTLFEAKVTAPVQRPQARVWLEKSAQQQHAQASYPLGLIYKNGYGITPDARAAVHWFETAVRQGNPDAMFMRGNAYLEDDGVVVNQAQGVKLLQQAAELEHPLASQALAYAFRDGTLGLPRDQRQSEQMMMEVGHALRHPRSVF
jgi:uncharacterized protein